MNQETMNVYKIRMAETGDSIKALQGLQSYSSMIVLIFTQQKAKMYKHSRVVQDTNMKKNR